MIKKVCLLRLMLVSLPLIVLNGCAFIVKDDYATKYYGIDEQRGSEYLNKILEKQQQVYKTERSAKEQNS